MIDSMKCFDGSQEVLEIPGINLTNGGRKSMKFWTLSRKMSYEEHKKAEEDAIIRVMGEVIATPSVTWWKDIVTTTDFNEILKFLEEYHDKISQFRLGGIEVPDKEK